MQVKTNGNRNLSFEAPKKFKLLQNGVEIPYIRTGKNSVRLSRNIDGVLDVEEIQEAPKSIVRPMKLQAQQMALVNPNDVIAINQAAQQLEIEQNILSENQKRLEHTQDYIDIQQQKINQAIESVGMLETDNKERLDKTESSIFNLAGEIAKTGEQSINAIISVDEKINQHENAENPHKITKKTIKLDKVDNTSDLDKPVSKAVQAELDKKADKEELESIKEEISNYQEKTDRFNDALSNYTGGIGGTELPSGGFTGQLLAKKTDLTGDYEWIDSALSVGEGILTIQKNGTDLDTFSANAMSDKTINITVPTQASDIDALPDSTKYGSSLALSIDSSTYIITAQLKDQDGNNLGSSQTIDLPLESVVVNGSYDSENKKIVLTLENGNTIEIPVGDLISGLQTEITSNNKLDADLVDDSTSTNKFVTANDKTTWNSKQDALTAGTGIDITSDVVSNSGVRAVSTGATNGTISVNTNGTSAEVSVYGLGSAAYTSSSDYDTSGSASIAETNAKNYADSLASNYATAAQGALADTALQSGDNISELVNDSGFITGINSSDVTTALGYTPYDSSNPSGYTSNVGTVTSVNNTSPDGSGNVTITIPDPLPNQSGQSGKFLTTDGTDASWANVDALPSQTGQSGKYLTTDGTNPSWATLNVNPDGTTISTNSSNELQAIGVINSRDSSTAIKTWTGTKAQYDAIGTKDSNTLYNITDDTDLNLPILEALYPVGSVYITTANTCPLSTLISGSTWELVSSGRVLQGADNDHSAGTTIEAGLPNITGKAQVNNYYGTSTGAFYKGTSETTAGSTGTPANPTLCLDASRSSSIYGNSTTVQPPAYVVNIYRRTA